MVVSYIPWCEKSCPMSYNRPKAVFICKEMDVLRCKQTLGIWRPAFPAKRRSLQIPCDKMNPGVIAQVSGFATRLVTAAGLPDTGNFQTSLLTESRPIGCSGSNRKNPDFNAVPDSSELHVMAHRLQAAHPQ